MPVQEVLCLANSTKHGGRCVAGLRTDGGGWVRPVSSAPDGTLQTHHYRLRDGRYAGVLDILNIPLREPRPEPHQPENWVVGPGGWEFVSHPVPSDAWRLLAPALIPGPTLLGDTSDRISFDTFSDAPGVASLALVPPEGLHWQIQNSPHSGKRQVRAVFQLGGADYDLPLTDPVWLTRLDRLPLGTHPWAASGVTEGQTVLLTISLGEPFHQDNCCYKLVAAVVVLPDLS